MALLAIVGLNNAMAEDVKFDFTNASNNYGVTPPASNGDKVEVTSLTNSSVTISIDNGTAGTKACLFKSTPQGGGEGTITLRIYKNASFTISASSNFKKITFKNNNNNNISATGYAKGVWEGDAKSVTFTVSANVQISTIEVSFDGGGETPTVQEVTVEQALTVINGLADNGVTEGEYKVTGYVLDVTEKPGTHKNITFIIADNTSATAGLTVFRADKFNKADITNPDLLKKGDLVVVQGKLQKYVKSGTTTVTPEISQGGVILSINGKTEDDTPDPEAAITNGTKDNPMTAAQALAYINGFADGFTTTKQYYVKGSVAEIVEINTEKGNATFTMGGVKVFRVKGLENKNIEKSDYLKAGDEVIVLAKLQKYVESDKSITPELSTGYIYSLNGKTKEGGDDPDPSYTFVGDGSKSNPYTVEDILHMDIPENTNASEGQQMVWIKGYIIGSLNSSGTAILEGESISATNIGIAASASEKEGSKAVPVQLPNNTTIRSGLNVKDNPSNVGKEVTLQGYLLKYMNRTGMKNTATYILDGSEVSGVSAVTVDQLKNAPAYNLGGQRVNQGYKGLVIKGGKKLIQK